MKRWICICLVAIMPAVCLARGWDGDTLGDKLKRMFTAPSPTPKKKKKRSTRKSPKPTPTPTPSAFAPEETTPPPTSSASAMPSPPAAISPPGSGSAGLTSAPSPPAATVSAAPVASETPYPRMRSRPHAPLIEPVRAITPRPGSRRPHVESPSPGVAITSSPSTEERPVPMNVTTPLPAQTGTPTQPTSPSPATTPFVRRNPREPASIEPAEIADYDKYAPSAKAVVDLALRLTNKNLGYKYGAADPGKGGMDSSGFVQYVLKQSGVKDPPRDARDQYIWVRKAGTFQAVLARSDNSFELEGLKPGNLLFWASNFNVGRDPAITETAIYLGRDKSTNQRLMIGATDERTYKGQRKIGVSVLDFKVAQPKTKSSDEKSTPIFVGYARVPDWPNE